MVGWLVVTELFGWVREAKYFLDFTLHLSFFWSMYKRESKA